MHSSQRLWSTCRAPAPGQIVVKQSARPISVVVIWPDDVERPAKKWSNRPNRHLFRSCGPRRRRAPAQCWWTLAGLEWGPGRTKSLKPPLAQQCKASFHLATGLLSPQDSGQEVARKASVIAACKASVTAACKPSFTAAQKASITAARKASFTAARKIPSTAARKASLELTRRPFALLQGPTPDEAPASRRGLRIRRLATARQADPRGARRHRAHPALCSSLGPLQRIVRERGELLI